MKQVALALSLLALSAPAFAGTAMSVVNKPLGFTLTEYPQGEVDADICDTSGKCFSFNYVKQVGKNVSLYREVNGKCEITVETFDKSFRTGNTKNEFMLDLMAFVVKAIKGETICQLTQQDLNTPRAVTGIYE